MTQIEDLPADDLTNLRRRVISQLESMDDAEFRIKTSSRNSLIKYVGELFQDLARAMGYVIAFPFVLATSIARGIVRGFGQGWNDAWNALDE